MSPDAVKMGRDFDNDLRRFGYLARRQQLLDLGHSRSSLAVAVRTGRAMVPRRGWIAGPGAGADALRAVSLGGRLGGSSALASYGIWIDQAHDLIVWCSHSSSRLPPLGANEVRLWGGDQFPSDSDPQWRVSVADAIEQHSHVCEKSELIATIDSALRLGRLSRAQLPGLIRALPRRIRPSSIDLDGRSMSGTESHMRVACRARGYRVELQVSLDRIGIVDLMVDGWLIVECDSKEHHRGEENQRRDRKRDGNALLTGHSTVRFTYAQVMFEREWCMDVIAQALGAGQPHPQSTRNDPQGPTVLPVERPNSANLPVERPSG